MPKQGPKAPRGRRRRRQTSSYEPRIGIFARSASKWYMLLKETCLLYAVETPLLRPWFGLISQLSWKQRLQSWLNRLQKMMAKLFLQKKWNRSSVPKIEQLGREGFLVAKPKADYQRAGNLLLLLPKRAWCSRWERRGFLLECRPPGQNPHPKSTNSLQHVSHTCAACRGALPGHATW